MSVAEKGSHVIRMGQQQTYIVPFYTLQKYAGSLQTGIRMAGLLIIFFMTMVIQTIYNVAVVLVLRTIELFAIF